jgi:GNAT superfamily N-acetyltransferase
MGSTIPQATSSAASLPDASSPDLTLTHPTPAERTRTWKLTHAKWGGALSEADYLGREAYMMTVPLAKNGGLTHWILTIAGLPPDERPVLSSCETLRKRGILTRGGGDGARVQEGMVYGIGSVFTDPTYRGKGYASRMMKELGAKLRDWQVPSAAAAAMDSDAAGGGGGEGNGAAVPQGKRGGSSPPLFSVLYSDIGKQFYARAGWAPFASSHAAFKPVSGAAQRDQGTGTQLAKPIGYHELAELCCVDEKLMRADLVRRPAGKTHVALIPELDQMLWHLMREDFITKCIFGRTPTVKGAVAGEPGKRIWAVWTRGYHNGLETSKGNTLHVLRVVVEDEKRPEEELVDGFTAVMQIAQTEAAEWNTEEVQMWNPTPKVRGIIERCGLECEYVDRDTSSIASLKWYGDEPIEEVDWVANEKYAWC